MAQKKRKAILVDRDGTINVDCHYCSDVSKLIIYPDIIPLLKEYQDRGYLIIVITNQSGINRGFFTEEDLRRFNEAVEKALRENGISIAAFYYCPHRPDENCDCRKPRTGMVERAIRDFNLDIKECIFVGDSEEMDGGAARNLGIPFIKVEH